MFTGLVEEVGTVSSVVQRGGILTLDVTAKIVLEDVRIGDSIAIAGVCQTVTAFGSGSFTVEAVAETIGRTTFGRLRRGDPVNLERSLKVGDRLGGHIVQGHVDGTGRVTARKESGGNVDLTITAEAALGKYIVEKGAIAVDGVSLTVTHAADATFGITVIPHTMGATTLERARPGDEVNLETDIIVRHIEKLMGTGGGLTTARLRQLGY